MKHSLFGLIATIAAVPAVADVSASVAVSQPGFFGQIAIGDLRPAVIYAEPVWVARPAKVVYVEPVYLRIPPGHEKKWSKYCGNYGACGRPVSLNGRLRATFAPVQDVPCLSCGGGRGRRTG